MNRQLLLDILAKDHIPQQIIYNVYNLYQANLISIKTGDKLSEWKEINSGVRQGCGLSPLLFNIYMNAMIQDFRENRHGSIPINRHLKLDTIIFADDLVLLATSEDDLQWSVHNLNLVAQKYSMEISTEKTKIMAFCGKYPVPSKICVNNKLLERLNIITYLGYKLSFLDNLDISEKILKFNKSMGVINRVLKPSLVQKATRVRLYKIMARPILCYGSEAWTLRKRDESRLTACEMRFMRRTAGYTKWDHKKNEDVLQELNISPVLDHIYRYQQNWKEHVSRMGSSRFPKAILKYRPNGKRSLGRPMKRWHENHLSRP